MIVPLGSPDNPDLTTWAAQCDRCQILQAIDATGDWLISDDHLDFHMCPPCEHLIGVRLMQRAAGPALPRFLKLMRPRRKAS